MAPTHSAEIERNPSGGSFKYKVMHDSLPANVILSHNIVYGVLVW